MFEQAKQFSDKIVLFFCMNFKTKLKIRKRDKRFLKLAWPPKKIN